MVDISSCCSSVTATVQTGPRAAAFAGCGSAAFASGVGSRRGTETLGGAPAAADRDVRPVGGSRPPIMVRLMSRLTPDIATGCFAVIADDAALGLTSAGAFDASGVAAAIGDDFRPGAGAATGDDFTAGDGAATGDDFAL